MATHYIPFLLLLLLSSFCKSDDQLTHAKPLTYGDTLVSESGDFVLGFFSPTSSKKSFYLGIWYHNLPGPRTMVWVANRDNPITTPSSAVLTITNNSHLVLSDSEGHNIIAGAARAHALLLNSGNFVLRLPNTTIIWQSFDHPTDTILPTMKFVFSYKAKVTGRLVAWKGFDDPSSGDFSYSSDPSSPDLQVVTWNKTRPYCRMNVWNGKSVAGGTYHANSSSMLYQTTIISRDEFYFMFNVSDNSPFTRIMLDYTGKLKVLSWNGSSWALMGERPAAPCDLYASCGPFSYCDFTQIVPMCQCLDGFEPDDTDFMRGCRRIAKLKCGKQSNFVTLPEMKVPDNFLHMRNRSFDECRTECRRNCSCTALAYTNLRNAGDMADPSRCLIWSGGLIDIGKIPVGENLYLRLANSTNSTVDKNNNLAKILLPIIAFMLLLASIALVRIYIRGKWRKKDKQKKLMLGYFSTSNQLEGENTEVPFVGFEDILLATNYFADSNLLGREALAKSTREHSKVETMLPSKG